MKHLLLALLLAGCTQALPPELPVKARPEAKYKGINEFTMTDGCKVRTDMRWWNTKEWEYRTAVALNIWSDKCSEPKGTYTESEIVSARYK